MNMPNNQTIFRRGHASLRRLLIAIVCAVLLIVLGATTKHLDRARAYFLDIIAPIYGITDFGNKVADWSDDSQASRETLLKRNQTLRDQNLILQRRVIKSTVLQVENTRLRQLLGAAELFDESVLIAELIGTPPDTETHRLIVDRGADDDLVDGMPVLAARGVMGQIVTLGEQHSEVLLISDRTHALPVEISRTGARAIAQGVGDYDLLRLRNVPSTMDLKVGDEVITSGLGGHFPHGYPVGKISRLLQTGASPFLEVDLIPHAGLSTTRQMLVLFAEKTDIQLGDDLPLKGEELDSQGRDIDRSEIPEG